MTPPNGVSHQCSAVAVAAEQTAMIVESYLLIAANLALPRQGVPLSLWVLCRLLSLACYSIRVYNSCIVCYVHRV